MPADTLTQGDQVVRLIEKNGGEMQRAEILDQVDFSSSRLDNVLGDLVDENRLDKPSRGLYTLASDSHTGNNSAQSTPTGGAKLQAVPELEAGAGDEMVVVNNDLQLPKHWIRQTYGIRPERLCVMRVRGDSMVDTLRPGQRLVAAKQNGEDLEDGVIYGLRNDHGFSVKRLRFDRKEGERVIWIWSDNPDYEKQRRWLTLPEFEQEYSVVAKALEVGQKL